MLGQVRTMHGPSKLALLASSTTVFIGTSLRVDVARHTPDHYTQQQAAAQRQSVHPEAISFSAFEFIAMCNAVMHECSNR